MAEHERIFSSISAYVGKLPNVELRNDLQAGTMTVVFKSPQPTEGPLVALKIYGTRNVEITLTGALDWHNFRRGARIYADALALMDCFHLIEVEEATPEDPQAAGKGGLRIARAMQHPKG
jgi:hypothetical protein